MIDKEIFAQAMGMLTDRFNRPLHPTTSRMYYEILSEELDTDQVMIAARRAIRHEQFWPSPQQLIDYAVPPVDLNAQAVRMFDALMELGHDEPARGTFWRREEIEELGEATLAGWNAIGKQDRLRNLDARDLPFCRREFIAAYIAKATETHAEKQIAAARAALEAPRSRSILTRGKPTPIGKIVASETAAVTTI